MSSEDQDVPAAQATGPVSTEDADRPGGDGAGTGRRRLPWYAETGVLLVVVLVLALLIKTFLLQTFSIPSESMNPTLQDNDRILVQKVSGDLGRDPRRGDVVVFEDPGGWLNRGEDAGPTNPVSKVLSKIGLYPSGGYLVKRVVGIPGDTIQCCNAAGEVVVNGQAIDEKSFIQPQADLPCDGPMTGDCMWSAGPVPKDSVFVMGDNRDHSADSTVHLCLKIETDCTQNPFVSDDLIVGKVWARIWPVGRIGFLHRPDSLADVPDPQ